LKVRELGGVGGRSNPPTGNAVEADRERPGKKLFKKIRIKGWSLSYQSEFGRI